jgi:predicted phosphate transport protein (TIGR00153 family)
VARFQILPAETKFYDWFEKGSANLLEAARLLHDLMTHYERPASKVVRIVEAERQGDFIVHEITDLLRKTLITPFDPEETQAMMHAIDDVVDSIEQAADKMVLYQIEQPTDEAHEFSEIILRCAQQVNAAMPLLRDNKELGQVQKFAVELNRLEMEGDELYRRALQKLITSRDDWFEFTRWKDIYDELESVCDRCEDIADVLQAVVLKNA